MELWIAVTALAGLALGFLIAWLLRGGALAGAAAELAGLRAERQALDAAAAALRGERDSAQVERDRQRDAATLAKLAASEAGATLVQKEARLAELAAAEADRDRLAADLAALRAGEAARAEAHALELKRLNETFAALADKALDGARAKLGEQAEALLVRHRELADAGLGEKHVKLGELIAPMRETLVKYEERLKDVEAARVDSYGQLKRQLTEVAEASARVGGAAAKLETALRSSGKVAGRWGEEQCRNVLEAAGLVEGVDFEAQYSVEEGAKRPDFKLTLPGGRALVIDVKCSVDAYVSAAESEDEPTRATHLAAHARAVRGHATSLAGKDYAKSVEGAVEFVLLFVPGENFLAAALQHDRALMNDFFNKRVVLAGPVNLVAVARTVAALRDQARLATEAAEIGKLGRELYDSLRIMADNIAAVGKSLGTTVTGWNKLVGQLDGRVMLRARRLRDMGTTTGLGDLAELRPVEALPALAQSPELLRLPASEAAE